MDPNEEIEDEFPPFFRRYKSGRLERLSGSEVVPPSLDPATGVDSKDVVIDPSTGVSARIYLPNISATPTKKLRILVYYHGGGFFIITPFHPSYHSYLTSLAAKSCTLIVSVHYRLAPEHPLPAAYDDALAALNWVVSHSAGGGPEPWLAEHGDFDHLFIAGESAGANISHHVAMQPGVEVEGVALVHPFFWGTEPVGAETTDPEQRGFADRIWRVACPASEGLDDPRINPLAASAPSLAGLGCRRVVVFVAGDDYLVYRGRAYYEGLLASGWKGEAELVEDEGVDHVFYLLDPEGEKSKRKMEKMVNLKGHRSELPAASMASCRNCSQHREGALHTAICNSSWQREGF